MGGRPAVPASSPPLGRREGPIVSVLGPEHFAFAYPSSIKEKLKTVSVAINTNINQAAYLHIFF